MIYRSEWSEDMIGNFMQQHDTFIIPAFIISPEIIEFFKNKKTIIHYNFEWFNDNGQTSYKNINIERVYTLDKNDIEKEDVKVCWLNEEIPENIKNILNEMLKIEIQHKENKPHFYE